MNKLCEFCGAYSPKTCEMEDDFGYCSWIEAGWEDETDPDRLREDRDERQEWTDFSGFDD